MPSARTESLSGWTELGWFIAVAAAWSVFLLTVPLDPGDTSGEPLDDLEAWRASGVLYPTPDGEAPSRASNDLMAARPGVLRRTGSVGVRVLSRGHGAPEQALVPHLRRSAWPAWDGKLLGRLQDAWAGLPGRRSSAPGRDGSQG